MKAHQLGVSSDNKRARTQVRRPAASEVLVNIKRLASAVRFYFVVRTSLNFAR